MNDPRAKLGLDIKADNSNVRLNIEFGGKAVAIMCGLASVFVGLGVIVGINLSRQTVIEGALRENTVATDLAKYNAQEVRIQAEVNKILSTAILARGCDK